MKKVSLLVVLIFNCFLQASDFHEKLSHSQQLLKNVLELIPNETLPDSRTLKGQQKLTAIKTDLSYFNDDSDQSFAIAGKLRGIFENPIKEKGFFGFFVEYYTPQEVEVYLKKLIKLANQWNPTALRFFHRLFDGNIVDNPETLLCQDAKERAQTFLQMYNIRWDSPIHKQSSELDTLLAAIPKKQKSDTIPPSGMRLRHSRIKYLGCEMQSNNNHEETDPLLKED